MHTNDEVDDPDVEEAPVRDPCVLRLLPVDDAPRAAIEVDRRGLFLILFLQQWHRRRLAFATPAGHLGFLLISYASYVQQLPIALHGLTIWPRGRIVLFAKWRAACVGAWELP